MAREKQAIQQAATFAVTAYRVPRLARVAHEAGHDAVQKVQLSASSRNAFS